MVDAHPTCDMIRVAQPQSAGLGTRFAGERVTIQAAPGVGLRSAWTARMAQSFRSNSGAAGEIGRVSGQTRVGSAWQQIELAHEF